MESLRIVPGSEILSDGSGRRNATDVVAQVQDLQVFSATARSCSPGTSSPNDADRLGHLRPRINPDVRRVPARLHREVARCVLQPRCLANCCRHSRSRVPRPDWGLPSVDTNVGKTPDG